MLHNTPSLTTPRLYEMVGRVLEDLIRNGQLPTGLVLLESPIAELFQTSRAPVQRALRRLESDDVIHRFEGRGYLVGTASANPQPLRRDILCMGIEIPDSSGDTSSSRASWERIYATVEHEVASCLVFGTYRIFEAEMADHFGVSRTVVRDVLGRLNERGLIRKNTSSHWLAGPLTAKAIRELYELRRLLEPSALLSAFSQLDRAQLDEMLARAVTAEALDPVPPGLIERIEQDLYTHCILATPNELLGEAIRHAQLPLRAAEQSLWSFGLPTERVVTTNHRIILELLLQDAPDAAAAVLKLHLQACAKRSITLLKTMAVIPIPTSIAKYLRRQLPGVLSQ